MNLNRPYSMVTEPEPGDETEEETVDEYRLGTFELRGHLSLSEK
jgi:hypothetical protein